MFRDIISQKKEGGAVDGRAPVQTMLPAAPATAGKERRQLRFPAQNENPPPHLSSVFWFPASESGFGIIAAIFAVVFLGLFGLLAAKHLQSTATGSAEARIWAQALYTAESTARLKILDHDGGGTGFIAPTIEGVNGSISNDTFTAPDAPAALESRGSIGSIVRKIQVKYIL